VKIGKPLRAMWTFTVADEHLAGFLPADGYDGSLKPCKTLGAEFHRFQRWLAYYCETNGHKPPVYLWSIESVSSGERDYHPHLCCLTSLVLKRGEFREFAPLAEAAFGIGSVHMEVIHNANKAASYLLKAVKYSIKGHEGNQGRVWGQRWAVSSAIRPVEVRESADDRSACWELEEVASLLRDVGRERVQTPFGSVTVRGFYPRDGFGSDSVWLACAYARGELEGVAEGVLHDASEVGDPF
jgi:hypothetical protein